jgi:SnoaL-like domain
MERVDVEQWVAAYERLWRTPGTELLSELFTPDASYLVSPWAPPVEGLDAIAQLWESRRDGPDEEFAMSSSLVAVDGATAVVRVFVDYPAPAGRPWRDLWVLRFNGDGRCSWFEEWPFAPDEPEGTT